MTAVWIAAGALAWLVFATAVAVVIGKSAAHADRREVEAAVERHPSGKKRHLRVVAS